MPNDNSFYNASRREFFQYSRIAMVWNKTDVRNVGPSPFIPGFELYDAELETNVCMRFAAAGSGSPVLMVHGHPHNHVIWRKVAPALARNHTLILADLRGYGDSGKPASDASHRTYSKKEMCRDLAHLMQKLGLPKFHFVGHDRGGRVGHRFALDFPKMFLSATFIDIAPTLTMYERTTMEFARRYFWWFFLIQPEPLPEKLILSDPAFFLDRHISGQIKIPGSVEPEVMQEYLRCYRDPAEIHAICEDYRAAATIDLKDDCSDSDKRIACPLLLLWGARGTVGQLYDVVETWRDKALDVRGFALDCGHSPHEEVPEDFLEKVQSFIASV